MLVVGILPQRPSLADLDRGARWLLIAMTVYLLDGAIGRMLVIQLTLIAGIFFIAMTGRQFSLFFVFVLIKLLFDLVSALPLSRPGVTDVRSPSAERRRAEKAAGVKVPFQPEAFPPQPPCELDLLIRLTP